MKNFRVTVNGNAYDVSVEELSEGTAPIITQQTINPSITQQTTSPSAPVVNTAPAPIAKTSTASTSAQKINSPMPGTVLEVKVKEGDIISKNQLVLVLEAMKMENEIVSPFAGKVVSVNTSKGSIVNSGDLLVSIEE